MSVITRRAAIGGLAALACLPGCARRAPIEPPPDALRLGWRLIPGDELVYETRTVHHRPGGASTRVERWTYLVTGRDQAVATLQGFLVGLGGHAPTREVEPGLARERAGGGEVQLHLGVDGRLRPRGGAGCEQLGEASADCFAAQLVHRMLALPLPAESVAPGETWIDPDLPGVFAPLLGPPAAELIDSRASCSLFDLYRRSGGSLVADLRSTALLGTSTGLSLRIDGLAAWDPARGVLSERRLTARTGGQPGGELELHTRRVG